MTPAAHVALNRSQTLERIKENFYGYPLAEEWSYDVRGSWWTQIYTAYLSHPVEALAGIGCKGFTWSQTTSDTNGHEGGICLLWAIGEDAETIFAKFADGQYLGHWQKGDVLFKLEGVWKKMARKDNLASYRHKLWEWIYYPEDGEWDYAQDSPKLVETIERRGS